ncbi:MAG TPA: efflux RND transporter periplasmic adaptor subunit [Bryobacteraceae bacterium]|nr:efflux RND transporter periplasmic adaptor subunit [Bryobacteraceae bacterium]
MARPKWLVVPVLVVLAALVAGAIGLLRQSSARKTPPAKASAVIAPPPADVSLPVRIQAREVVAVTAQVSGTIQEFLADVGDEVYQDQLLARVGNQALEQASESATQASEAAQARISKLESAIVAARLEASRARADAERSRSDMERADKARQRQRVLVREGATPRLVYEKSEKDAQSSQTEFESLDTLARHAEERVAAMLADLDNSKKLLADKLAQLEDAREHLKAAEVHSPVDGIVVARKGEAGKEFGETGDRELFRVAVNTANLQAVVEADPSALARLTVGQQAMLFFADIPGEGLAGTISAIQDHQALIDFTSPTPVIRPGMTAQVRLTLR